MSKRKGEACTLRGVIADVAIFKHLFEICDTTDFVHLCCSCKSLYALPMELENVLRTGDSLLLDQFLILRLEHALVSYEAIRDKTLYDYLLVYHYAVRLSNRRQSLDDKRYVLETSLLIAEAADDIDTKMEYLLKSIHTANSIHACTKERPDGLRTKSILQTSISLARSYECYKYHFDLASLYHKHYHHHHLLRHVDDYDILFSLWRHAAEYNQSNYDKHVLCLQRLIEILLHMVNYYTSKRNTSTDFSPQRNLATAYFDLGSLSSNTGLMQQALELYMSIATSTDAVSDIENVATTAHSLYGMTSDSKYLEQAANTYVVLANHLPREEVSFEDDLVNIEQKLKYLLLAIDCFDVLYSDKNDNLDYCVLIADAFHSLSQLDIGENDKIEFITQAIEYYQHYTIQHPTKHHMRRLAQYFEERASICLSASDYYTAAKFFEQYSSCDMDIYRAARCYDISGQLTENQWQPVKFGKAVELYIALAVKYDSKSNSHFAKNVTFTSSELFLLAAKCYENIYLITNYVDDRRNVAVMYRRAAESYADNSEDCLDTKSEYFAVAAAIFAGLAVETVEYDDYYSASLCCDAVAKFTTNPELRTEYLSQSQKFLVLSEQQHGIASGEISLNDYLISLQRSADVYYQSYESTGTLMHLLLALERYELYVQHYDCRNIDIVDKNDMIVVVSETIIMIYGILESKFHSPELALERQGHYCEIVFSLTGDTEYLQYAAWYYRFYYEMTGDACFGEFYVVYGLFCALKFGSDKMMASLCNGSHGMQLTPSAYAFCGYANWLMWGRSAENANYGAAAAECYLLSGFQSLKPHEMCIAAKFYSALSHNLFCYEEASDVYYALALFMHEPEYYYSAAVLADVAITIGTGCIDHIVEVCADSYIQAGYCLSTTEYWCTLIEYCSHTLSQCNAYAYNMQQVIAIAYDSLATLLEDTTYYYHSALYFLHSIMISDDSRPAMNTNALHTCIVQFIRYLRSVNTKEYAHRVNEWLAFCYFVLAQDNSDYYFYSAYYYYMCSVEPTADRAPLKYLLTTKCLYRILGKGNIGSNSDLSRECGDWCLMCGHLYFDFSFYYSAGMCYEISSSSYLSAGDAYYFAAKSCPQALKYHLFDLVGYFYNLCSRSTITADSSQGNIEDTIAYASDKESADDISVPSMTMDDVHLDSDNDAITPVTEANAKPNDDTVTLGNDIFSPVTGPNSLSSNALPIGEVDDDIPEKSPPSVSSTLQTSRRRLLKKKISLRPKPEDMTPKNDIKLKHKLYNLQTKNNIKIRTKKAARAAESASEEFCEIYHAKTPDDGVLHARQQDSSSDEDFDIMRHLSPPEAQPIDNTYDSSGAVSGSVLMIESGDSIAEVVDEHAGQVLQSPAVSTPRAVTRVTKPSSPVASPKLSVEFIHQAISELKVPSSRGEECFASTIVTPNTYDDAAKQTDDSCASIFAMPSTDDDDDDAKQTDEPFASTFATPSADDAAAKQTNETFASTIVPPNIDDDDDDVKHTDKTFASTIVTPSIDVIAAKQTDESFASTIVTPNTDDDDIKHIDATLASTIVPPNTDDDDVQHTDETFASTIAPPSIDVIAAKQTDESFASTIVTPNTDDDDIKHTDTIVTPSTHDDATMQNRNMDGILPDKPDFKADTPDISLRTPSATLVIDTEILRDVPDQIPPAVLPTMPHDGDFAVSFAAWRDMLKTPPLEEQHNIMEGTDTAEMKNGAVEDILVMSDSDSDSDSPIDSPVFHSPTSRFLRSSSPGGSPTEKRRQSAPAILSLDTSEHCIGEIFDVATPSTPSPGRHLRSGSSGSSIMEMTAGIAFRRKRSCSNISSSSSDESSIAEQYCDEPMQEYSAHGDDAPDDKSSDEKHEVTSSDTVVSSNLPVNSNTCDEISPLSTDSHVWKDVVEEYVESYIAMGGLEEHSTEHSIELVNPPVSGDIDPLDIAVSSDSDAEPEIFGMAVPELDTIAESVASCESNSMPRDDLALFKGQEHRGVNSDSSVKLLEHSIKETDTHRVSGDIDPLDITVSSDSDAEPEVFSMVVPELDTIEECVLIRESASPSCACDASKGTALSETQAYVTDGDPLDLTVSSENDETVPEMEMTLDANVFTSYHGDAILAESIPSGGVCAPPIFGELSTLGRNVRQKKVKHSSSPADDLTGCDAPLDSSVSADGEEEYRASEILTQKTKMSCKSSASNSDVVNDRSSPTDVVDSSHITPMIARGDSSLENCISTQTKDMFVPCSTNDADIETTPCDLRSRDASQHLLSLPLEIAVKDTGVKTTRIPDDEVDADIKNVSRSVSPIVFPEESVEPSILTDCATQVDSVMDPPITSRDSCELTSRGVSPLSQDQISLSASRFVSLHCEDALKEDACVGTTDYRCVSRGESPLEISVKDTGTDAMLDFCVTTSESRVSSDVSPIVITEQKHVETTEIVHCAIPEKDVTEVGSAVTLSFEDNASMLDVSDNAKEHAVSAADKNTFPSSTDLPSPAACATHGTNASIAISVSIASPAADKPIPPKDSSRIDVLPLTQNDDTIKTTLPVLVTPFKAARVPLRDALKLDSSALATVQIVTPPQSPASHPAVVKAGSPVDSSSADMYLQQANFATFLSDKCYYFAQAGYLFELNNNIQAAVDAFYAAAEHADEKNTQTTLLLRVYRCLKLILPNHADVSYKKLMAETCLKLGELVVSDKQKYYSYAAYYFEQVALDTHDVSAALYVGFAYFVSGEECVNVEDMARLKMYSHAGEWFGHVAECYLSSEEDGCPTVTEAQLAKVLQYVVSAYRAAVQMSSTEEYLIRYVFWLEKLCRYTQSSEDYRATSLACIQLSHCFNDVNQLKYLDRACYFAELTALQTKEKVDMQNCGELWMEIAGIVNDEESKLKYYMQAGKWLRLTCITDEINPL